MQHSDLNFHLNISIWSLERARDGDGATESEAESCREDKREEVVKKLKQNQHWEEEGDMQGRRERWIEWLIAGEGGHMVQHLH